MMQITLIPQVAEPRIQLVRAGDVLSIDGRDFDFTGLPEGAVLPASSIACDYIVGPVTRQAGRVHISLRFPIAPDAPHEACWPAPIIDPPDGPIALPGAAT